MLSELLAEAPSQQTSSTQPNPSRASTASLARSLRPPSHNSSTDPSLLGSTRSNDQLAPPARDLFSLVSELAPLISRLLPATTQTHSIIHSSQPRQSPQQSHVSAHSTHHHISPCRAAAKAAFVGGEEEMGSGLCWCHGNRSASQPHTNHPHPSPAGLRSPSA